MLKLNILPKKMDVQDLKNFACCGLKRIKLYENLKL